MKTSLKVITVAAALFALNGCATYVTPRGQATTAPAERVYKYQAQEAGTVPFTVIRDSGTTGMLCKITVYIDRVRSASLKPGEKADFWIKPGNKSIGVGYEGSGLCGIKHIPQERYIPVEKGTAVRIYTSDQAELDVKAQTL